MTDPDTVPLPADPRRILAEAGALAARAADAGLGVLAAALGLEALDALGAGGGR